MSLLHRRAEREAQARTAVLEQQLAPRLASLALAQEALGGAIRGRRPLSEVRAGYHHVSRAFDAAITATEALERSRPGDATGQLEDLRRRRQRHLLTAPSGVLIPDSVRPVSHAAYGPHIPGMDFDPDDPTGAPTGRRWGLDLTATLDGPGA